MNDSHQNSTNRQDVCAPYQLLARISKTLEQQVAGKTCYYQFEQGHSHYTKCRLAYIAGKSIVFGARRVSSEQTRATIPSYFFASQQPWDDWFMNSSYISEITDPVSEKVIPLVHGWRFQHIGKRFNDRSHGLLFEENRQIRINTTHAYFPKFVQEYASYYSFPSYCVKTGFIQPSQTDLAGQPVYADELKHLLVDCIYCFLEDRCDKRQVG
jgi:hypothetical protein